MKSPANKQHDSGNEMTAQRLRSARGKVGEVEPFVPWVELEPVTRPGELGVSLSGGGAGHLVQAAPIEAIVFQGN